MANKKINELVTRTPSLSDLILVGDPSSGYSYKATVTALATIIETDIADGFVTLSTTQTISGAKTFSNNLTLTSVANAATTQTKFLTLNGSNVVNYRTGAEVLADIGGQGTISLAAIGSTPNANGATLSSNTLTLQPASASFGGVLTTGFQEIAGWKRFTGNPIQFDNHLEIKNLNSWGVSWGYTSFASKNTPVFGFLRGDNSAGNITYNAWFTYGTTGDRNYTLPSTDGTLALTSDITSSVSGTTNYIPKFTSSSAIGNSDMVTNASGHLLFNSNDIVIGQNTSDGSDNRAIYITGGATQGVARGANLRVFGNEYSGDAGNAYLFTGNVANSNIVLNAYTSTSSIQFLANNAEQMRLTSTGLGIGTSSPAYKLDVAGIIGTSATGLNSSVRINNTTATTGRDWHLYSLNNGNFGLYNNTASSYAYIVDASGNLGLGVTPSAWGSGFKVLQVGSLSSLYSSPSTYLGHNVYFNSGNKYVANGYALLYGLNESGQYVWYQAASGTAGNAISFTQAMTLNASGNLGLGVTPSAWRSTDAAFQIGLGAFFSDSKLTANISQNHYFSSTGRRYIANGYATDYEQYNGYHAWKTAPSGTAGNAITFTQAMTLNASGNLGLGVTPSAWSSGKAIEIGNAGNSFWGIGTNEIAISANAYYNGGWKYAASTSASLYQQYAGQHIWYNAPSGTAGNAISFTQAMTLDASGRLGIGTTSPSYLLDINSSADTYSQIRTSTIDADVLLGFSNTGDANNGWGIGRRNTGEFWIANYTGNFLGGTRTVPFMISTAGNVGIGTTSPTYPLTVVSNSSTQGFRLAGRSSDNIANMSFTSNDQATEYAFFNTGATYFALGTNGSERMRITSAGNVGIGTTAPGSLLDVVTSTAYDGVIRVRSTGTNTPVVAMGVDAVASPDGYVGTQNNVPFAIRTNDVNRIWVTTSGNVGIGTASPNSLFEINKSSNSGSGSTFPRLAVKNSLATQGDGSSTFNFADINISSGNEAVNMFLTTTYAAGTWAPAGIINVSSNHDLQIKTNNTERMRITSTGNVGVGVTAPDARLTVLDEVRVKTTTTTGVGLSKDASGAYLYNIDNTFMAFGTNNTERMRIASGGQILVGKSSTSVDVKGLRFDADGAVYMSISNADASYYLRDITNAAYRFYVNGAGTIFATNTTISAISDIRYKENVRDLDSALNKLMLLKPRVFDWKEGMGKNIKNDKGFIAQEFEQIFPELVDKWKEKAPQGEEPYKSIRQDLIPYLVKAIQELKAEIETLKNK